MSYNNDFKNIYVISNNLNNTSISIKSTCVVTMLLALLQKLVAIYC